MITKIYPHQKNSQPTVVNSLYDHDYDDLPFMLHAVQTDDDDNDNGDPSGDNDNDNGDPNGDPSDDNDNSSDIIITLFSTVSGFLILLVLAVIIVVIGLSIYLHMIKRKFKLAKSNHYVDMSEADFVTMSDVSYSSFSTAVLSQLTINSLLFRNANTTSN
jgi:hypothetical protein